MSILYAQFVDWVAQNHIGDMASLAGVAIAIVGFGLTIHAARKSRAAADRAETAAREAVKELGAFDTVANLGRVASILNEVKVLNRVEEYPLLIERLSTARRTLIAVKASTSNISQNQKTTLQSIIQQTVSMEGTVEGLMNKPVAQGDVPRMNRILSRQVDRIEEVLGQIRSELGD